MSSTTGWLSKDIVEKHCEDKSLKIKVEDLSRVKKVH